MNSMAKKKNWVGQYQDGQVRKARVFPYLMVIVYSFIIFSMPLDVNKYKCIQGELLEYRTNQGLILVVESDLKRPHYVKVDIKSYRAQIMPILPQTTHVKIWINKKHNTLKQLEADGKLIIPYDWWVQTRILWCFVLVGAVSIPFTERSYRKWRRNEEQTVAMEEQQESLRYEKIRQRTGNVLAQYGMTVKSCLIFNLPYPEKYDYYMVEDNPLSKGKLCVRVSRSERDVIELIKGQFSFCTKIKNAKS